MLTYDPSCATRGQQGLKSYRLSKMIFDAMLETEKRLRLMGNAKVFCHFLLNFGSQIQILVGTI